jgi:hypothetical protein
MQANKLQFRSPGFEALPGLRHHFASRLVQLGVPLNTVRDLLGHSSVAMSIRYAHLAPDQRREAVAKLDEKPLLALTVGITFRVGRSILLSGGERGTRTRHKPMQSRCRLNPP